MEQILLAYGLPKETVSAIIMLYRNTKVKVRSPTFCSRCTARRHISLFIICLDNVLRTSIDKIKENGIKLRKERSRRYPAKTITDADNADDIALLANAPTQAETLLHSLERAAAGIGFHVNAHNVAFSYTCSCRIHTVAMINRHRQTSLTIFTTHFIARVRKGLLKVCM